MTLFDHLLVVAFAFAYPAYAYITYRRVKNDLIANKPGARIREYRETIAWLWFLGVLALFVWVQNDRSFEDLGLGSPSGWFARISMLLIALAAVLMTFKYRAIKHDEEQRLSLRNSLSNSSASEFLPHTDQEAKLFVGVSISAGICEEFLFRGFLIWYFNLFSVSALAVVFSAILFGIAHSYQGWRGGLQSGAIGLLLAVLYVLTGSLWVPILLHIVGDIHIGILGWLAFGEHKQPESA